MAATTIGAVATLINTAAEWFLDKDGYAAFTHRRALAAKKKEAQDALANHDFDAVQRHVDELRKLATKP